MNIKDKSFARWGMIAGYLGLIAMLIACSAIGMSSQSGLLQINNGVVEVKDSSGNTLPVAGTSTFDLTSPLENTNPWTVAGKTLQTNATTKIDTGLKTGDLVHVRGTVLQDGTWLAYSIEHAADQTQPVIVLIGQATSVNPWIVNGITLKVTNDTKVQGTITPGMLVRVEIQLLADGTWKVLSIAPVGNPTEVNGCAQVIATVVAINGNQVQFLGWPTTVILAGDVKVVGDENANQNGNDDQGENENDNEGNENSNENANTNTNAATATAQPGGQIVLTPNQVVLVVLCNSNGQVVITQIIILNVNNDNEGTSTENGGKVTICHKPDKKGGHTITVDASAVPAHMAHGDKMGPCP